MSADRYIAAAQTASLVLLVTLYLAVDIARSNLPRLLLLADARDALVAQFIDENVRLSADGRVIEIRARTGDSYGPLPIVNTRASALKPRFGPDHELAGIGRIFVSRQVAPTPDDKDKVFVYVQRRDGRQWITTANSVPGQAASVSSDAVAASGKDRLRDIALELNLEPKDDYQSNFRAIEYELIDRRVDISGIGVALRSDLAPWLITILNVGLLILIRNHVRRALASQGESEDEEPWLLLDGHIGLERVASLVWLAALWAAPWISSGVLLMTIAARIQVDGSITSVAADAGLIALAMSLVVAGGWVSLTLVADVIALRHERRAALTLAEIPESV